MENRGCRRLITDPCDPSFRLRSLCDNAHSSYPLLSRSAIHLHDLLESFTAVPIRRVVSLGVVVYRACYRNYG